MFAYTAQRPGLRHAIVQAEWTNTVDRIQQLCPMLEAAEVVDPIKPAVGFPCFRSNHNWRFQRAVHG